MIIEIRKWIKLIYRRWWIAVLTPIFGAIFFRNKGLAVGIAEGGGEGGGAGREIGGGSSIISSTLGTGSEMK